MVHLKSLCVCLTDPGIHMGDIRLFFEIGCDKVSAPPSSGPVFLSRVQSKELSFIISEAFWLKFC